MKIRRYTCKDIQEALLKVKMDLGSEAVIINSRKVRRKGLAGLFAKPMIEVVAAIDDDYVRPSRNQPRSVPVSEFGPGTYYNNAAPAGQPAGVYPQTPAYGQAQMGYQAPNSYQTMTGPAPSAQQTTQQPQYQTQHAGQQMLNQMAHQISQQMNQGPAYGHMQPQTQRMQTGATARTAAMPRYSPASGQNENTKLLELENKVKNIETMLERIYLSVREKSAATVHQLGERPEAHESPGQENLHLLRRTLENMELDLRLIDKIMEKIREYGGSSKSYDEVLYMVSRIMTVFLGEPETIKLRSDGRPQVVIFVGPTGVGKTTTLAKIAADFTLNRQKKVGLITADTYRIAAVEQLKTYSEILNIPVVVVYSPNEVQDAIRELSDKDLVLIDTAGRSHRNKAHFDELKALVNAAGADESYLVVSANTGRRAMEEILEYYSFMKDYRLIFTKLDETPVPGAIFNARYLTGKPLSYTTAGQSVPDDLDVANPRVIVANLLGSGKNK
jgi:flagellar biosynthetic protein FlhF